MGEMRTEKLDRLITALGNPVHQVRKDEQNNRTTQEKQLKPFNDDAVTVDSSLCSYANQLENSGERQAKLDRLASQIKSGSYQPSSEAVSVAFIKELGI